MISLPSEHVDGSLFNAMLHSQNDCAKLYVNYIYQVMQLRHFLCVKEIFLLPVIEKMQWLEVWTSCGSRLSSGSSNPPITVCDTRGIDYLNN
jgi:hypothetical protein